VRESSQPQDQVERLKSVKLTGKDTPFAIMTGTVIGLSASSNKTTQSLLIRPTGRASRSSSWTKGTSASARVNPLIFSTTSGLTARSVYSGPGACFLYNYLSTRLTGGGDLSSSMEQDFIFLGCDKFVACDNCPKRFSLGGKTVSSLKQGS
jgi:hypothetical protein